MNWNRGRIPLLSKEGWPRPKKISRSHLSGSGRGGLYRIRTTPAAPVKERGHFLEARSHPSLQRRGMRPRFRFIHTFKDRALPLFSPSTQHLLRNRADDDIHNSATSAANSLHGPAQRLG